MFLICKLAQIKLIVDFHNYGYTLLALNVKVKPLIWVAKTYEKIFAKTLDYGLCVSKSMQRDLKDNWGINSVVVYDKPNQAIFGPISIEEKHDLFKKLLLVPKQPKNSEETLFTQKDGNKVIMKENRPMLLVSSTSWTKDEDFSILFEAMEAYEQEGQRRDSIKDQIQVIGSYPHLHLIITGKGPEKERYLKLIDERKVNWKHITIETKWLEANDYPKLLASADLGICLHYSSSGVDLPMKVVDMFGSVLPVAAIDYACIDELVQNNKNGHIFKDSKELGNLLKDTFGEYPTGTKKFEKFKENIKQFREKSFDDEWRETVLPIIKKIQTK
jgi:beta-1,4-mannosyltransferase